MTTSDGDAATTPRTAFDSKYRSSSDIKSNNFVDTTDQLANDGLVISFCSAINRSPSTNVEFKAFITAYNETFSSDYVSEQVFGRIDPIQTFKQTTRSATLSFQIPCSTPSESFTMLSRVDKLRSYLYPTYTDVSNALTIDQNPLVRIKIMNLVTNNQVHNDYESAFGGGQFQMLAGAKEDGILTAISNMNVNFNLENEAGVFEAGIAGSDSAKKGIYPKLIEISIDFVVIHERNLGDGSNVYGTPNELDGGTGYQSDAASDSDDPQQTSADETRAEEESRPAAEQAVRDGRIASFANALRGRFSNTSNGSNGAGSSNGSSDRRGWRAMSRLGNRISAPLGEVETPAGQNGEEVVSSELGGSPYHD